MYAWLPAPLRGGAWGRGWWPGQMPPGRVPGGPFRGSNPNSLKESNGFQKGKECSSLKDGGDGVWVGGAGREDRHRQQPILTGSRGLGGKGKGKSFIKDALKCKAHALRHRFGCISRKCPAIKDMVSQLQRECYLKHDLCSAARDNTRVMAEMIHFKDLLLHEPYVDLVNLLLTCGEEMKEAITRSVQAQCEQNWGSLCSILSFCTSAVQRPPTAPPERQPQADRAKPPRAHHRDAGHHLSEPSSRETGRGARGERGSKSAPNAHARARGVDRGAQGTSGSSEWEEEPSEYSDIRR